MSYNYAFKSDKDNVVRVVGKDLPLSRKVAIEMCAFIKGMPLTKAKNIMEKVMTQEIAVPFRRFTEGAGHKKGVGGGKYPFKAAQEFLKLFKLAEANAQNKGLSPSLQIIHACAQQAPRPFHYGRKRRIKMKRVHVEIAVQEMEASKKEDKDSKKTKNITTQKHAETSKKEGENK